MLATSFRDIVDACLARDGDVSRSYAGPLTGGTGGLVPDQSFLDWLKNQRERNDHVADLANDWWGEYHRAKTIRELRNRVRWRGCHAAQHAFKTAYREWRRS